MRFAAVPECEVRRGQPRPGPAGLTWRQVVVRVHAVRVSHGALLGDHAVCGFRYATAGFEEDLDPWPAGPPTLRCMACAALLAQAGLAPGPASD